MKKATTMVLSVASVSLAGIASAVPIGTNEFPSTGDSDVRRLAPDGSLAMDTSRWEDRSVNNAMMVDNDTRPNEKQLGHREAPSPATTYGPATMRIIPEFGSRLVFVGIGFLALGLFHRYARQAMTY